MVLEMLLGKMQVAIDHRQRRRIPPFGGELDANGNDIDMGTNVITDAKLDTGFQVILQQ